MMTMIMEMGDDDRMISMMTVIVEVNNGDG